MLILVAEAGTAIWCPIRKTSGVTAGMSFFKDAFIKWGKGHRTDQTAGIHLSRGRQKTQYKQTILRAWSMPYRQAQFWEPRGGSGLARRLLAGGYPLVELQMMSSMSSVRGRKECEQCCRQRQRQYEQKPEKEKSIMSWCVSPKFTCWSLKTQYLRVWLYFGDKAFHEVIKLKWSHQDGPQSDLTGFL